jgi:hypothetical protein
MSAQTPLRRPFVEPVVSDPIDALDATRVFGGMLGQGPLGGGSSGTAIDDGDYCAGASFPDSPGQDSVDPGYACP